MAIPTGRRPVALDFGFRQGAHHLGGGAKNHGTGRGVHFARDQRPRAHDAVIANLRAVEYGSTHADEHVVAHGAAVDDGAVADGAAGTHCCLLMHHRAVLNVGVFPHSDSALVAPENGVVPHADVVPQRHIAYNGSAGADQNALVKIRFGNHGLFLLSL